MSMQESLPLINMQDFMIDHGVGRRILIRTCREQNECVTTTPTVTTMNQSHLLRMCHSSKMLFRNGLHAIRGHCAITGDGQHVQGVRGRVQANPVRPSRHWVWCGLTSMSKV